MKAAAANQPSEPTSSKEATTSSLEVPPGSITLCRSGSLKRRKTEATTSTSTSGSKKEMKVTRTESGSYFECF